MASSRAVMRNLGSLKRRLQAKELKQTQVQIGGNSSVQVQVMHASEGGVQVGGDLVLPRAAPFADLLAEHARECPEATDINEPIVLPEPDKHADIDALAVPEERRPSKSAPIRRLLGYLIRLVLRKWVKRIDGK